MDTTLALLKEKCTLFLSQIDPEKKLVFGEGTTKPALILVGEAPGEQEEKSGKPFVGKAGKNLDIFLDRLCLKREEIYITNVVKMRPTAVSKTGRTVNRTPTKEEILAWLPYLKEEIAALSPALIVTLGNTPLHALLGFSYMIGTCHAKTQKTDFGANLFPLYHPAAIIYNRALTQTYFADLQLLSDFLSQKAE